MSAVLQEFLFQIELRAMWREVDAIITDKEN